MSSSPPLSGEPNPARRDFWSFVKSTVPGVTAFSPASLRNIRYDIVAALMLAGYVLPVGLADATLAGLPPEAGLYACLFSGLVFWLFCSSQLTAITVTSAISLLIGSSLGDMAGGDPAKYWALAAGASLMVAVMSFAAWALRAGALVSFISETVLVGFKAGVAIYLTSTQLPKLFGFKGSHGNFWERIHYFFTHIHETNLLALTMGLTALALILLGKVFLKNKPVALFVMVAAIIVTSMTGWADQGLKIMGDLPKGLQPLQIPAITWSDVDNLLPVALACFLLAAVETTAVGRMFAVERGQKLDSNQELLALSAANLASGLGRGYPVSGGMSQSLVNESAGARTPLSGFLAACIILIVTIFLSGLLRNLPQTVLAAIVLAAITGLIKVKALKRLWHFNRGEFAVAMVALLGVLTSGVLRGVLFGTIITILMLLRRASRPYATELGQVPGTTFFSDLNRHKENSRIPGVTVFRVDGSILYFNVDYVRDRFMQLMDANPNSRLAILFLGTVPTIDLAGAELLAELHHTMKARGTSLRLAEAHGRVREALHRSGFEEIYGKVEANQTVTQVIAQHKAEAPTQTGEANSARTP